MPEWGVEILTNSPYLGLLLLAGYVFIKRDQTQMDRFEKVIDKVMHRFDEQDKRSTDAIVQNSNIIGQNSTAVIENSRVLLDIRALIKENNDALNRNSQILNIVQEKL